MFVFNVIVKIDPEAETEIVGAAFEALRLARLKVSSISLPRRPCCKAVN